MKTRKYYAIIDTFLKRVDLYVTKEETAAEITLRKAVDSSLSFIIGDHYRVATVKAPYSYKGKEALK